MGKSFDFKGRLNGNIVQQRSVSNQTQATSVINTFAGKTMKESGWGKKFQVLDIPLNKLHEYPEQKVFSMDEAELEQLTENVRSCGVLQPLIVRVHPSIPGDFEIVAGHRRREAAKRAGMETVPCQVYMGMTDSEAKTVFYATNMGQRSELLPSERAAGYAALADVLKLSGAHSVDEVAKAGNESRRTVYQYLRLTRLIPELLEWVDDKSCKMSARAGAVLADLSEEEQNNLFFVLQEHDVTGVTEKRAREIVALKEHDIDSLTDYLFPVKEKKVQKDLKLPATRFEQYFLQAEAESNAEKFDLLERALRAFLNME